MSGSAKGDGRRAERVVLVLVALVVAVLAGALVLQTQQTRSSAAAQTFPQLTQPPPSVAVPTAAFIGDSYSVGTGSSGSDSRFTTLLAAYEGWLASNDAYGGTGYLRSASSSARTGCGLDTCPNYSDVIGQVAAANPTIVVVSGGRNDVGLPEAQVTTAIDGFYTALRKALPNARIIVTSPLWAYSSPPAQLAQITDAVQQAAAGVGAQYLDIGQPLVDDRTLVGRDRVHPNDAGHAEIARVIEVALSKADSTPSPSTTDTGSGGS